jgi:hypothetical protein
MLDTRYWIVDEKPTVIQPIGCADEGSTSSAAVGMMDSPVKLENDGREGTAFSLSLS